MIRINLLPHREMRRERRKKEFVGLIAMTALAGLAVALIVGAAINSQISAQEERNALIEAENTKLDKQIQDIATLRAELEALKARQQAVEDLQRNRTIPVHLLAELVRHTPEGIYLRQLRQNDKKVGLVGYAQTNEHVADLLRKLANDTPWMDKPELTEIKSIDLRTRQAQQGRAKAGEPTTLYEFSLNALVRGPAEQEAAARAAAGQQKPGVKAVRKVAAH